MLLLLLILAAFPLILLIYSKQRKHGNFNPPPGPKGLPLIGNLHQFDQSAPFLYLFNLGKIYGPILSLRFGCRSVVVIQSATLAKEVLKTQDHNFCSRPTLTAQRRLSYNGKDMGFAPYNEYYKEMKKLCVVQLFSSKMVQSSSHIREEEVYRMIQKIASFSSEGKIVNLSELLMCLTSSIICRMAFGKRYEDEELERSRFHGFMHEIQALFISSFFSDYFPFIGCWIDKFSGLSSRLDRLCKGLDEFYNEIIDDHLDLSKRKSEHEDIVDVLLQIRKEGSFPFELTLDHIKAIFMNIIIGGVDTISTMLVWAMTELMRNPHIMKKVQDELRNEFTSKNLTKENDIPKLEYLKAVVKETFRLRPMAPLLLAHETLQKCTVQGYDILPKTIVFVNAWAIGRDPEIWKDPEIFIPERFLGSSINWQGHDFELIPFGAGRRTCPGMLIGAGIFEHALANLLYFFDWELPAGMNKDEIDTDILPGLIMHKKNPLCLVPKKSTC